MDSGEEYDVLSIEWEMTSRKRYAEPWSFISPRSMAASVSSAMRRRAAALFRELSLERVGERVGERIGERVGERIGERIGELGLGPPP
jgi:hypothetical protein